MMHQDLPGPAIESDRTVWHRSSRQTFDGKLSEWNHELNSEPRAVTSGGDGGLESRFSRTQSSDMGCLQCRCTTVCLLDYAKPPCKTL